MVKLKISDGMSEKSIDAVNLADARRQAIEWAEGGDYPEIEETIWITVRIYNGYGCVETVVAAINPPEPKCASEDGHNWQSPHALVGGCPDNPGVRGAGAGLIIHEACVHCGAGRRTETDAQNPQTGERGLRSIVYEIGRYRVSAD